MRLERVLVLVGVCVTVMVQTALYGQITAEHEMLSNTPTTHNTDAALTILPVVVEFSRVDHAAAPIITLPHGGDDAAVDGESELDDYRPYAVDNTIGIIESDLDDYRPYSYESNAVDDVRSGELDDGADNAVNDSEREELDDYRPYPKDHNVDDQTGSYTGYEGGYESETMGSSRAETADVEVHRESTALALDTDKTTHVEPKQRVPLQWVRGSPPRKDSTVGESAEADPDATRAAGEGQDETVGRVVDTKALGKRNAAQSRLTMPLRRLQPPIADGGWCIEAASTIPTEENPAFLSAHVYVRVRLDDRPELSRLDLLHWLTYYKYMGVDHVYLYDTWVKESEQLLDVLQPAIDAGFITYHSWHENSMRFHAHGGSHVKVVELPAKQHCFQNYRKRSTWFALLDMDEYPFMESDQEPGFLARFIERETKKDSGAFLLHNFIMFGLRNYSKGDMLIQQVTEKTMKPYDNLFKPIVRADCAMSFQAVHQAVLNTRVCKSQVIPPDVMQKNHFWGGRYNSKYSPDWTEVPPREVQILTKPANMSYLAEQIQRCPFQVEGNRRAYEGRLRGERVGVDTPVPEVEIKAPKPMPKSLADRLYGRGNATANGENGVDDHGNDQALTKRAPVDRNGAQEVVWRLGFEDEVSHDLATNDMTHMHLVAVRGYPEYYIGNVLDRSDIEEREEEEVPDICHASASLSTARGNIPMFQSQDDCYVRLPKTGSSTIASGLSAHRRIRFQQVWFGTGESIEEDVSFLEAQYEKFTWTVVREPLDRFCSGYAAGLKKVQGKHKAIISKLNMKGDERVRWVLAFNDEHYPFVFERHQLPQLPFLVGPANETHAFNFIFDIQQLNMVWENVMPLIRPTTLATVEFPPPRNVNEASALKKECTSYLDRLQRTLEAGHSLSPDDEVAFSQLCSYLQMDYECLGYPVPPLLQYCNYEHGDWFRPYSQESLLELFLQ